MAFWSLDASVLALLFTVGGLVVGGLAQARAPSPGAGVRLPEGCLLPQG